MIREGSLEEISDGKLYGSRDLVKVDTEDCKGCSACCQGMGGSIILDPMDVHKLTRGLQRDFMDLMADTIELNVGDGMILPNLRMQESNDSCCFLNEEGRCRIHAIRPGFCRLFPLGRYYEGNGFSYILQAHECVKGGRKKVRVSQWIGIEKLKDYERFCLSWHRMQKYVQEILEKIPEEAKKSISMYVLKQFYMVPYSDEMDFYAQFDARLAEAQATLDSFCKTAGV